MTGILLGLGSALAYGAADFFGGMTNRRAPLAAVVAWSQLVGLAALLPIAVMVGDQALTAQSALWGALAGFAGSAGVALLYHGLSVGRMSTVAPLAGVMAAGLPFTWGVVTGERPSAVALVGVALALVAIVLVSRADGADVLANRRGAFAGLGAGGAFGCMYVLLAAAGPGAGLWPVVMARLVAVIAVAFTATVAHQSLRPPTAAYAGVAITGVLDMTANVLYLFAARAALVALAAVLASLYPAATILLARVVLRERLKTAQKIGLLAAGVGVVLIAL